MDKYHSFDQLTSHETDYHIEIFDRGSTVTILAPHGGTIEPHTSEIAALIAGEDYNLYCFNGTKQDDNGSLHISSHRYNETQALGLVRQSTVIIALHGCKTKEPLVFLGGLDAPLKKIISSELDAQGVPCAPAPLRFAGTNRKNICNRGVTGKGIQLEISRALRDSPPAWSTIAVAVRTALTRHEPATFYRTEKPASSNG